MQFLQPLERREPAGNPCLHGVIGGVRLSNCQSFTPPPSLSILRSYTHRAAWLSASVSALQLLTVTTAGGNVTHDRIAVYFAAAQPGHHLLVQHSCTFDGGQPLGFQFAWRERPPRFTGCHVNDHTSPRHGTGIRASGTASYSGR